MTARTIQQLFDLTGKTALVTGGSRGLGLQMAHALGEAGAKVMLSSRKAEDLEQACAELQAAGIDARWIAADCAKDSEITRLADETLERMGDVDILVNNAGAAWGAPAEDHPADAWDKVMNLNVRGYFLLSQAIAKKSMIARRQGRIINIASIAGLGAHSVHSPGYLATKAGVISLTQTTALDVAGANIYVNAIACGGVLTPDFESYLETATETQVNSLYQMVPSGRLGHPEEYASVAVFLAAQDHYLVGQVISPNGGFVI